MKSNQWPRPVGAKIKRLKATLFGSLTYTGIGHASVTALVILELPGYTPDTVNPA